MPEKEDLLQTSPEGLPVVNKSFGDAIAGLQGEPSKDPISFEDKDPRALNPQPARAHDTYSSHCDPDELEAAIRIRVSDIPRLNG